MRIVFMGTPDYSVKTLEALISAGHNVVGVFAQPDKPVGRKQILTPPPVKQCAIENNIPVFQPTTLKDGSALQIIKELNPEVIVVVAYGKILPREILDYPKYGCVNGHASLLPKLRGSAPIQWAIINGEEKTGVTIMQMDDGIDTGDILEMYETEIGNNETAEELFERLAVISADGMVKSLQKLVKGELTPIKQDENLATYAPMIKKEMAHIDFTKSAKEICNAIRGYYPWPCAFIFLDSKRIKVISAKESVSTNSAPGTVIKSDNSLVIAAGNSTSVEFLIIQPEGSKQMTASQMLCGKKIPTGTVAE